MFAGKPGYNDKEIDIFVNDCKEDEVSNADVELIRANKIKTIIKIVLPEVDVTVSSNEFGVMYCLNKVYTLLSY